MGFLLGEQIKLFPCFLFPDSFPYPLGQSNADESELTRNHDHQKAVINNDHITADEAHSPPQTRPFSINLRLKKKLERKKVSNSRGKRPNSALKIKGNVF